MKPKKAIEELTDLKNDLFPYLHQDYNTALELAIQALVEKCQRDKKGAP